MSIKVQRSVFASALFLGVIWNCLCLIGVFPLGQWRFSLALAGAGSLVILLPLLFPLGPWSRERSQHIKQLAKGEKVLAGLTLSLCCAWAVTIAACLVYPL